MPPSRIWITGSTGSGKTTLGRTLAARLGVPHLELDSLYHGPGWAPADPDRFRSAVLAVVAGRAWVVDGNYQATLGDLVARSADLQIALDPRVSVVMVRVLRRTLRRGITGQELWNGNREQLRNLVRRDPGANIVLWAWKRRHVYHDRAVRAERDGRAGSLPCVRLRSAGQVRRFIRYLAG